MEIDLTEWSRLEKAFDYAVQNNSFHKVNLIRQTDNVCVFGLGKYFQDAFVRQDVMKRFGVNYLCDNNVQKREELQQDLMKGADYLKGIKGIISPDDLKLLDNPVVILMLGDPRSAIEQLKDIVGIQNCISYNDLVLDEIMGVGKDTAYYSKQKERFFQAYSLLEDNQSRKIFTEIFCLRVAPHLAETSYESLCCMPQYFPKDIIALSNHESFVDCGANIGDTMQQFSELVDFQFSNYYAFEMDQYNFLELEQTASKIKQKLKTNGQIICYPYGVWRENTTTHYGRMSSSDSYSIFNEHETETAQLIKLDSILQDKEVSFVKMDIEGAELEALYGVQDIIRAKCPKLAICVYHRVEDLWQIPLFIKELNPNYKFYMRHHAKFWVSETVCYAVPTSEN